MRKQTNIVFVDVRNDLFDDLVIVSEITLEGFPQLIDLDIPASVLVEVLKGLGEMLITPYFLQVH